MQKTGIINTMLPLLTSIGLTQKEIDIYEILLKKGELQASEIIKESKFKRATVYKSLYSLEAKGLVTQQDIAKKIHFKPQPPSRLIEISDQKLKEQERARYDLQRILPELTSSYILTVEKPVVSIFEGVKGLKEIYEDTLREGQPIFAALTTAEVHPELFDWLNKYYSKQRVKRGISAKVIVASGAWSKEYTRRNEAELRETVMVPSSQFPFQHEVDIYGDKVAFINYKKDEALIGVVINHPQIAKTMKAWFDLGWMSAAQMNP